MKKFIKVIMGFGLAVVMGLGALIPANMVYAADEPKIKVGLPNSVFNTRNEFLERFDGYIITYNGAEYATAEFFDAFSGSEFKLENDSVYDDIEKAITVTFRSGNPLPKTTVNTATAAAPGASDTASLSQPAEVTRLGREGYASDVEYMTSVEYTEAVRQEFYRLINEYRKANGLMELEVNLGLQAYADIKAAERRIRSGHVRPDGTSCGSGWYNSQNFFNTRYAENEASNTRFNINPEEHAAVHFNRWKNSEGHNRHMLYEFDPQITMAFGIAPEIVDTGDWVSSPAIFATGY